MGFKLPRYNHPNFSEEIFVSAPNAEDVYKRQYKDRIFTTSVVGWDGVQYIGVGPDGKKDFTPIIEKALELGG